MAGPQHPVIQSHTHVGVAVRHPVHAVNVYNRLTVVKEGILTDVRGPNLTSPRSEEQNGGRGTGPYLPGGLQPAGSSAHSDSLAPTVWFKSLNYI